MSQQLAELATSVTTFSIDALLLYPGIQASTVQGLVQETVPPVRGLVIEAFGEGNAPSTPAFLEVLSNAHQNGVVLIDNTQVLAGEVNNMAYQTGSGLAQAGAISAYDMTPEASLTKLVYLFGLGMSPQEVTAQMQVSLRGEITPPTSSAVLILPVF